MVTKKALVGAASGLRTLQQGNFVEFCEAKLSGEGGESSKWDREGLSFLRASFFEDSRGEYLRLLGVPAPAAPAPEAPGRPQGGTYGRGWDS